MPSRASPIPAGSGASAGLGGLVLATSHGFLGQYVGSRFSRSASVIAGEGTGMERDYDYSSRLHFADLEAPGDIGRKAGERAVRRLNARKATDRPGRRGLRSARGARHRRPSGRRDQRRLGGAQDQLPARHDGQAGGALPRITVTDDPLRVRGQASRPFDGEGVEGERLLNMVEDGVLQHWFLSTSAARELGLETNGRGARAGSSVSPSSTNLAIEPGERRRRS